MEDRTLTDASLVMYKAVRNEFDNIGIVLQSRLFRTPDDIKALHTKPCRVRICIGIYKERAEVALQDKPDMKERLFEQVNDITGAKALALFTDINAQIGEKVLVFTVDRDLEGPGR